LKRIVAKAVLATAVTALALGCSPVGEAEGERLVVPDRFTDGLGDASVADPSEHWFATDPGVVRGNRNPEQWFTTDPGIALAHGSGGAGGSDPTSNGGGGGSLPSDAGSEPEDSGTEHDGGDGPDGGSGSDAGGD
jgi:hypothetical protein